MADRALREADLPPELRHPPFMRGEAIAVHQDNRKRTDASIKGRLQSGTGSRLIKLLQDRPIGHDAFRHLDDLLVEQLRQDDLSSEEVRAILVSDAQLVAEAPGDG